MKPLNHRISLLTVLLGASLVTSVAQAQWQTGHYPGGVEGLRAATLPPPGVYFRDYNAVYYADRLRNGPPGADFELTAYINAPRLIWMTDWKILGADYGMDLLVPLVYTDFQLGGMNRESFELGDIHVEPLLLSWHFKQFDLSAGYAFWAPTGDFDPNRPVALVKGFWSSMFTLGATWYPDEKKAWAASVLNRFEIHTENDTLNITPGESYTLEFGLSRAVTPTFEVGLIGYYQQQLTDDRGRGVTYNADMHPYVVGLGPEVSFAIPKWKMGISARYAREVAAEARPEGNTFVLTVTKRF